MVWCHSWWASRSRPKHVAGSAEGYSGHVNGRLREGLTLDDRGKVYIADTDTVCGCFWTNLLAAAREEMLTKLERREAATKETAKREEREDERREMAA